MGLTAREEKTYDPVSAGVHQGICTSIYDLGTQYSKQFDKSSHQCLISWELPTERIEINRDGKTLSLPRIVSKTFTMSLGAKANLRKYLESWRGRVFTAEELVGFDISKLAGVNCMLQIIHNSKDGKTYANIAAILPLYKGMLKMTAEAPIVIYSLEDGEPPEGTPKWIAEIIHNSAEWKGEHVPQEDGPPVYQPDDDSSVPF
jgi:hypothetical protein